MKTHRYIAVLSIILGTVIGRTADAQDSSSFGRSDSQMVFGTLTPTPLPDIEAGEIRNAAGIHLLISTNGYGLGFFYRHEYSADLAGFVDFSISDARDDREIEYRDYYTGIVYTPGKINRFLVLPLMFGVQHRLFKDDIVDNFRPYISAAAGPTMVYVFPYNLEYFEALGKGRPRYTFGGYIGAGAFFGSERGSLFGISARYQFVPYGGGIESLRIGDQISKKNEFGGFVISLTWGGGW